MKLAALAVTATFALAAPRLATADCAMPRYGTVILTPAATQIGDDGGIVVASQLGTAAPATPPDTWRFGSDKPAVTTIAPGLLVYRAPTKQSPVVLRGSSGGPVLLSVEPSAHAPALPAPNVSTVEAYTSKGRHSSHTVYAVIDGDPPRGAVALVVFDKRGGLSFGTVTGNAKQLEVYGSSDCGPAYDGTTATDKGDVVWLRWLDVSGVLSAPTKPIKIVKG